MARPLRFIHIGMPKAASSFLQTVLFEKCGVAVERFAPVADYCLDKALPGDQLPPLPSLNLTLPANSQPRIVSNESLVAPFLNEPEKHSRIRSAQRLAAEMIGRQKLTDRLLVIVREPIGWLHSMHHQSIKQGGAETFSGFLESHDEFLRRVLNLRFILDAWTPHMEAVKVLPMELLKADKRGFLTELLAFGGIARPDMGWLNEDGPSKAEANVTPRDRMPFLARMNAMTQELSDLYMSLDGVPEDKEQYRNAFLAANKWVTRRITELASEDDFGALADSFGGTLATDLDAGAIPATLLDAIDANYLKPLRQDGLIGADYLDRYEAAVETARRGESDAETSQRPVVKSAAR